MVKNTEKKHCVNITSAGIVILLCMFLFSVGCTDEATSDNSLQTLLLLQGNKFAPCSVSSPQAGYIDSIFINAAGDRIYFLHSKLAPNDFLNGTTNYPEADLLPGHTVGAGLDWNTDLYYIQWNGLSWSAPVNLGSALDGTKINSLANECCAWLNDDETEIIFYRENMGNPALGDTGNYISTRATRNDEWSAPVPLDSTYGTVDQADNRYRHDVQKTPSGDLYLWEHDSTYPNKNRLLYGEWTGSTWSAPALIAGTDSSDDETQPWVSRNELTLLFNRRLADGNTSLMRMTRADTASPWSNLAVVPITGFADPAGKTVWGEPTLSSSENYMLFIQFDTSLDPWKAEMMYAPGTPAAGFSTPIRLNQ